MRFARVMLFAAATVALAGCQTMGNDEGVRYLQRKDTVTLSAGDASQANAVAQTIHPWPRGVGDRRILREGPAAVRPVECYNQGAGQETVTGKDGRAPGQNNIALGGSGGGGTGGGASAGGGGKTQLNCGQ